MRGKLRQDRGGSRTTGSTPPGKTAPEPDTSALTGADTRDSDLLRVALRDVKPLNHANQRAEIDTPKPPPVPRPRTTTEVEDDAPVAQRRRQAPTDGRELFHFAMGDVTPIPSANRAEIGVDRGLARRRRAGNLKEAEQGAMNTIPLLPLEPEKLDPAELFRYAVRGSQPVNTRNRAELSPPAPMPQPLKHFEDEHAALRESLDAPMSLEDRLEMGDEAAFLRPGLPRRVLTDLRRGRWVLQGQLDLHGLNRDEARGELSRFLTASLQQGRRCVRVIHGKGLGSPGKESILKQLSRGWLAQREEILAFCQAGPHDGGSGALLVLLRAGNPARG
ncbi:Smr/MutS family protein [Aromatoleum diolicum]|uniref:Smr/MutS family protein n=1 Tax=Aromatoleum diolicum TaxID=75796 RepID=UPI003CCD1523